MRATFTPMPKCASVSRMRWPLAVRSICAADDSGAFVSSSSPGSSQTRSTGSSAASTASTAAASARCASSVCSSSAVTGCGTSSSSRDGTSGVAGRAVPLAPGPGRSRRRMTGGSSSTSPPLASRSRIRSISPGRAADSSAASVRPRVSSRLGRRPAARRASSASRSWLSARPARYAATRSPIVMLKYRSRPTTTIRTSTTHAPAVPTAPVRTALTPNPIAPPPWPVSTASGVPPTDRWNIPSRARANSAAPEAAIQRSAGMVFIHSMSAKPASSGAAKAIPHPRLVDRTSCHGRTMAPASGAKRAMTLMIASSSSTNAATSRTKRPLRTIELCGRRRLLGRRRAVVLRRVATGRVRPPTRWEGSWGVASCADGSIGSACRGSSSSRSRPRRCARPRGAGGAHPSGGPARRQ